MLTTNLSQWIGKTQTLSGSVGADVSDMLAAIFMDEGQAAPQSGDALPALWHWSAFTPKVPMAKLSTDGHPHRGDFLPPVQLPRRMWAGGSVTFHAPLHHSAPLRQASTITDVAEKSTSMTFVTLSHEIYEGETLAITETQNIVYLQIPEIFSPPTPKPAPEQTVFDTPVPISEALLFRYSAATFNAHRVHYDLPYAQQVEKYPGLVVHGPWQATRLLAAAINHTGKDADTFAYRGIHPMFHHLPLHVMGFDETPEGLSLCTAVPGSHQGMQAKVTWKEST